MNGSFFKILKLYRVGKLEAFLHICEVHSDKNIKRKETKNKYSPETINTYFIVCCMLYIHS